MSIVAATLFIYLFIHLFIWYILEVGVVFQARHSLALSVNRQLEQIITFLIQLCHTIFEHTKSHQKEMRFPKEILILGVYFLYCGV